MDKKCEFLCMTKIEIQQMLAHLNILNKRIIMESGTYTSILVKHDVKSIVGIFFLQIFRKHKLLEVLFHEI